jgi:hypothetical protein
VSRERYLLDKSALAHWPKPLSQPSSTNYHHSTVLHYDGDYDMIAAITGQPTAWVVPAGTAD